jgi:peptidoglycan/xylan/chitin deacetylase (PgdA/CDA1 family)
MKFPGFQSRAVSGGGEEQSIDSEASTIYSDTQRRSSKRCCMCVLIIVLLIALGVFLAVYFTIINPIVTRKEGTWDASRSLHAVNSCGTNNKVVSLTFDDGPSEAGTPNVLDALKKYGVKGTFFMSPAVAGQPTAGQCALVKRIYNEGHQIGSHSWDHSDFGLKGGQDIVNNLATNLAWIRSCSGYKNLDVGMFRPPFGSMDTARALYISKLNYDLASWTLDTLDTTGGGANAIMQNVLQGMNVVGSGQSVVTLMHDMHYVQGDALGALDQIIPYFKGLGYSFSTLRDCQATCNQAVCQSQATIWPGTWATTY